MTRVTGLRASKKEATRQAIEAAALDLFARRGFAETTVQDISSACDVAPRTFFRYFATKEEVLLSSSSRRLDLLLELLAAEGPDRSAFEAVRGAMVALAVDYERDRERIAARTAVLDRTPDLRARGLESQPTWEQGVAAALSNRTGSSLEARLLAGIAVAALRAAVDEWLAQDGEPDLAALVAEAFALFTVRQHQHVTEGVG